jgi:hypothetical protein
LEVIVTAQPELELTSPASPAAVAPRTQWLLATNQLNLMFMLAAGLVFGPKGFGRKYYLDTLSVAPGWIPLFADHIPAAAFEQATAEERHLAAVAANLDLGALRGPVHSLDAQGRLRALQWPDEAKGDEQVLFVLAPLPATWIQSILFPSKEASAAFRDQAADYGNDPVAAFKQAVKAAVFRPGKGPTWPPDVCALPQRDQSLHHVLAVGALQGLLVGLGNRGAALMYAAALLADHVGAIPPSVDDPLLRALLHWVRGGDAAEDTEVQARMLEGLLDAIVAAKCSTDDKADRDHPWCPPDTQQTVLAALEDERRHMNEPKLQDALARLIQDLEGLLGLGDATVSELLGRHTRPFSRGLILYFLRPHCADLLDLARDWPQLTDQDLLVAAALFAARGGWMELPQSLKSTPGLTAAISHRMAALAHRIEGSGLDLGPAVPRVRPLLELLHAEAGDWSKSQRDAALALARDMGWMEILTTRISLGRGDYRLQVDGRGVHLLLDGDVNAVRTEVDRTRLLQALSSARLPAKIESRVRKMLEQ